MGGLGPLPAGSRIKTREQAEEAITGLIGPSRRQQASPARRPAAVATVDAAAPETVAAPETAAGRPSLELSPELLERARRQAWPLEEMIAAARLAVERIGAEELTKSTAGSDEARILAGSASEITQARFRESVLWWKLRPVLSQVAPLGTMPRRAVQPVSWVILSMAVKLLRAVIMIACVVIGSAGVIYALSKGVESLVPTDNWMWERVGTGVGRFADHWQALLVQMGWTADAMAAPGALLALPIGRATKHLMWAAEPSPKPQLSVRGVGDWHWGEIAAAVLRQAPAPSTTVAAAEQAPAAVPDETRALLARAIELRDETRAALAEWDQDLAEVLFYRRLLSVTTEPLTAAFNDAFDKALDEVPDTPELDVPVERAREILETAQAAWDAWVAASRHAADVGLGTMTDQEREALELAKKYLAVAANPGATDQERHTSIRRVIDTLTSVTHRARGAVETEVFRVLDPRLEAIGAAPLRPMLSESAADPV